MAYVLMHKTSLGTEAVIIDRDTFIVQVPDGLPDHVAREYAHEWERNYATVIPVLETIDYMEGEQDAH